MAAASNTLITLENLESFLTQVKELIPSSQAAGITSIVRETYSYTASSSAQYSATIPNYVDGSCAVDIYLNGLLLVPSTEYTITTAGVFTTTNTVNSGGVLTITVLRWS